MRYRARPKRYIALSLSFLMVGTAIAVPFLIAMTSVTVWALPPALLKARTIGELIITLFAGAGTAITNPVVVPAVYSAGNYSIEYLVEEDILNVEGHPEYTNEQVINELGAGKAFNLDTDGFRQLMETNWQSMRDYQVDAVLRLNEIANTDSVYGAIDNLGGFLIDVAQYGYLGFENSIAIVANPLTVVKVGMENIRNAIYNVFADKIKNGIASEIIIPQEVKEYQQINGGKIIYSHYKGNNINGRYYTMFGVTKDDTKVASYKLVNNAYQVMGARVSDTNDVVKTWSTIEGTIIGEGSSSINKLGDPIALFSIRNIDNSGSPSSTSPVLISREECANYLAGEIERTITSPDIIGRNGNISMNNENEEGIKEGEGVNIIPEEEYNNFMDEANENTDNSEEEENAILYDNLINDNIVTPEEVPEEPTIPVQPTGFPTRPDITPEDQFTSLKGATPGIEEFFPFCIPGDVVALFSALNVESRKAPVIEWEWKSNLYGIDEEIVIDLSEYEPVANLLRTLVLILFITGLALATRQIIGA